MIRTTHTPGPWVDSITMGRSEKGVVAEAFAWMGRGPVIVATRAVREGEHMHNARLIAAAPDLLEALEEISRKYSNGASADAIARIARAALAKARGEG